MIWLLGRIYYKHMPIIKNSNTGEGPTQKQIEYIEQLFVDVLGPECTNPQKRAGLIDWGTGFKVKHLDQLSKNSASKLIDYLKTLKEQKK